MHMKAHGPRLLAALGMTTLFFPATLAAQEQPDTAGEHADVPVVDDGRDDFDFEIGAWHTSLRRLLHPLSGSTEWVSYEGTTVVRKVWDGRANLVELDVEGPAGRIEGLSLRLYNPDTRQWSLNFSSSASGTLSPPSVGEFRNGRGVFHSREIFNGRNILVRFVISDITPTSAHFEQAFSADDGKTWEVNWIATDTRITDTGADTD